MKSEMDTNTDSKITEAWARSAEAGPELDRICAEWMGGSSGFHLVKAGITLPGEDQPRWCLGQPRKFSTK